MLNQLLHKARALNRRSVLILFLVLPPLVVSYQNCENFKTEQPRGSVDLKSSGDTLTSFSKVISVAGRHEGHVDGVGRLAKLYQIGGMVLEGELLYFNDHSYHTIRTFDLNSLEVKTIAGLADNRRDGFADGIGSAARFYNPGSMAIIGDHLYIADVGNCAIRKLNKRTFEVTTLIGAPDYSCPDPEDGPLETAKLGSPQSLLAKDGFLYTIEAGYYSSVIRKIDLENSTVVTIAGKKDIGVSDWPLESQWLPAASSLVHERVLETAIETSHPYIAESLEQEITQVGALAIQIHFTQFETDEWEPLEIKDENDDELLRLKGSLGTDYWTPVLPVNKVKLSFYSSENSYYGFKIDKIRYVNDPQVAYFHTYDGDALSMHAPV